MPDEKNNSERDKSLKEIMRQSRGQQEKFEKTLVDLVIELSERVAVLENRTIRSVVKIKN